MDIIDELAESDVRQNLVVAVAGSGKTHTLTNVVARRIAKGRIDPSSESVVVFTFTNAAADELSVRLSAQLSDPTVMNQLFIGTIHGWCNRFLESSGLLSNTKVIDELERAQLLLRIYPILGLEDQYPSVNQFTRVGKFITDLELFYNESLRLNDDRIPVGLRRPLEEYLNFLKTQRLIDFGFLIREATRKLETEGGLPPYHLFVDEYQDVNPAQVKLLKVMLGLSQESSLLAVGDPRQAIYQWRGSDVSRILNFEQDFPGARVSRLDENRRSRPGIVRFANLVAENMAFDGEIDLKGMVPHQERVDDATSVLLDPTSQVHEEAVVRLVRHLSSAGVSPGSVAILLRSVVNHGRGLMDLLDEEQIRYFSPNRNAGTAFIENVMTPIFDLVDLMDSDPIPGNPDEERELNERIETNLHLLGQYCGKASKDEIHKAVADWSDKLTESGQRRSGRRISGYPNEAYNFRRQLFEFCEQVGLVIPVEQPEMQEGLSAITQIMRAIEEAYRRRLQGMQSLRPRPVRVFLGNLRWQLKGQIERWTQTGMAIQKDDRLTIATVHAAKGLEWPVVITPFLWKGRFPIRASDHETSFPDDLASRYGTTVEDERRLWYVAVTRARDRLYMYSGTPRGRRESAFVHRDGLSEIKGSVETEDPPGQADVSVIQPVGSSRFYHVSASDFLLLLDCPYQFHLRRIANVQVPVGEELGAGNIIHRVIRRVVEEGEDLDLKKAVRQEVFLPLGEVEHERRIANSIEKKVTTLIQSGLLRDVNLAEYRFSIPLENLLVSGVVDATRSVNDGIEVVDWKFSIHEEFRHRYENQIRLYSHALRQLGFDVERGVIHDLSASDSNGADINVDISEWAVQKMLERARLALSNLDSRALKTWPDEVSCRACDVSAVCPDAIYPSD